ncbi:phage antirepressor YoqD-like protein [Azospirillum lipoferum]|nr:MULTISPECIES: phage antirepressor KilAC domain-containing protein [Azospirillum]MCP1613962.1 phage antirepressor YoqD-like protein [Azospirillum lipoferum]MDW5537645.1 phage antirepressor KilAC domain-containing protein [Azospirillum sp. NL1]
MTNGNMPSDGEKGNASLIPSLVQGEPRIRDIDFAQRLGFANPIDIRKLIRRHDEALSKMGVLATVAKTSEAGGRPATEFYLNRKQAIFITAKSETAEATEITIEIIERFDSYERGAAKQADPMALLNDPAAMRGLLLNYSEKVLALEAQVQEQAPTVAAYNRIANADGLLCLTDAAKSLAQQPRAFTRWLFAEGYIYKRPGSAKWVAYQTYLQSGLFEHKVHVIVKDDGTERAVDQVMVTPKGLAKFARQLGVQVPVDLFHRPAVAAE